MEQKKTLINQIDGLYTKDMTIIISNTHTRTSFSPIYNTAKHCNHKLEHEFEINTIVYEQPDIRSSM